MSSCKRFLLFPSIACFQPKMCCAWKVVRGSVCCWYSGKNKAKHLLSERLDMSFTTTWSMPIELSATTAAPAKFLGQGLGYKGGQLAVNATTQKAKQLLVIYCLPAEKKARLSETLLWHRPYCLMGNILAPCNFQLSLKGHKFAVRTTGSLLPAYFNKFSNSGPCTKTT